METDSRIDLLFHGKESIIYVLATGMKEGFVGK